ncbi:MAG: hypothetical protein RR492_02075, partial [Enterococcus sp.]
AATAVLIVRKPIFIYTLLLLAKPLFVHLFQLLKKAYTKITWEKRIIHIRKPFATSDLFLYSK